MSLDTLVRDKVAAGLVYLYQRLDKTVVFQNTDDDTPVTLYADWKPETVALGESLKMSVERTERIFYIPRQTGFPPDNGVNMQATITRNGVDYQVESVDGTFDESPQLEITTTRKRAVNSGAL